MVAERLNFTVFLELVWSLGCTQREEPNDASLLSQDQYWTRYRQFRAQLKLKNHELCCVLIVVQSLSCI